MDTQTFTGKMSDNNESDSYKTLNVYIFFVLSISGDGRVTNWIIVKNSLWWEDKMTVMFQKVRTAGTSGASVSITTGTSGASVTSTSGTRAK